MSNLKVNSKCIKCGACLGLGFDFLSEGGNGEVSVKDNTFLEANSSELKLIIETCPVQAFEYDKNIKVKSKAEQLALIKEQLRKWTGLKKPTAKELEFKESEYTMNMPYIGGSSYIYSSDRAAESAAETQFNNAAYSKIDVFILQVISQYRVAKVGPYYSYGPDTNSVYYKENLRIIELLEQAEKLSEKRLENNFATFDVVPSRDDCYKMLNKGELVGDNLVDGVHREFNSGSYSSLSSYRMYYDTDDMEVYEGTGLFGKDKYSDKYCYLPLSEAINELEKDLRGALGYRKDEIQNHAIEITSMLIEAYNKKAKKEIERKIAML